jgi:putative MATE family efflux protein
MSVISNVKSKLTGEVDLLSPNVKRNILLFAIPVAFSGLLQIFYNLADQLVCAMYGSVYSYPAITATSVITSLVVNLMSGFSVGANVSISNALGSKDEEKGKRVIGSSYILVIICSIVLTTLACLLSRNMLEWLQTTTNTIDLANQYLLIYFLGLPFTILYNISAALLRGMGDSKRPFYILAIAGLINVCLNFLFVLGFKMDVVGVGLATVISQGFASIVTFIVLIRYKGFANLHVKYLRFYKREISEILKTGIPASIQSTLFSIPNMMNQSFINQRGDAFVAGSGAAFQLESFLNTSQNCFSQACIAFVAANYGAKNISNIKKSIIWCQVFAMITAIVVGVIMIIFRVPLLNLFLSKQKEAGEDVYNQAMEAGSLRMIVDFTPYIFFTVVDCAPSALRGLKHSTLTMIISLIGICGIRIIFLQFIYPLPYFNTPFWLYAVFPISWIITAIAQLTTLIITYKKMFKNEIDNSKLAKQN